MIVAWWFSREVCWERERAVDSVVKVRSLESSRSVLLRSLDSAREVLLPFSTASFFISPTWLSTVSTLAMIDSRF